MSAQVITFPVASKLPAGDDHPATVLAARLAAQLGGEDVVICADALARLLASICTVAAINETDAVETAELIGKDIVELTRGMMGVDGEPLIEVDAP